MCGNPRTPRQKSHVVIHSGFISCKHGDAGIDLPGHLITPVQRVPRYRLMLADLVKATEKSHPDYKLLSKARGTCVWTKQGYGAECLADHRPPF